VDERTRMKGRNKPTRRQKRKQNNVIEDRKPALRLKVAEEVRALGDACGGSGRVLVRGGVWSQC
jgi:hypothetical protein